MRRLFRLLVVGAFVCVSAAACVSCAPKNEDVVGHWTDTFYCETDKAMYYHMHWYPGTSTPLPRPWLKRVDKRSGRAQWGPAVEKYLEREKVIRKAKPRPVRYEDPIGAPSRPKKLAWGPAAPAGLKMGAHRPAGWSDVWCVIRNRGDRKVRYSDYFVGYWGALTVEARPTGSKKWSELKRRDAKGLDVKSAGASQSNVHVLEPGEEVPFYRWGRKHGKLLPAGRRYSFSVSLGAYQWPASWKGDVEVRISQRLGWDGSKNTWKGSLTSAVLVVPVKEARMRIVKLEAKTIPFPPPATPSK